MLRDLSNLQKKYQFISGECFSWIRLNIQSGLSVTGVRVSAPRSPSSKTLCGSSCVIRISGFSLRRVSSACFRSLSHGISFDRYQTSGLSGDIIRLSSHRIDFTYSSECSISGARSYILFMASIALASSSFFTWIKYTVQCG